MCSGEKVVEGETQHEGIYYLRSPNGQNQTVCALRDAGARIMGYLRMRNAEQHSDDLGWAAGCGWEGTWVFNCMKIVLCLKLDGGRGSMDICHSLYLSLRLK